ncbi:VOC family protein [Sphingomonas oligophenolica]|uniref:Lactoylglutathione lyase n=1 Tax=Sphingomonas oligophenolica TaxID=301154 RepID=A0A502CHT7_9SPHN|nr:VOC family protein [Sphingomonas oligophenolica]TPG12164.1 lactoylglutathione lyase [Sphingomonas oligophenolica]
MSKMIFVNLPVADVARSTAFYQAIGMMKNDSFSNEQGSAMTWSDTISFMLLNHAFYSTFTPKRIIDATTTSGMLLALGLDSRADVDAITEAAIAAGGTELHGPEDEGFMYSRAFADPDGHGFGPFWMDPVAAANGPEHMADATA